MKKILTITIISIISLCLNIFVLKYEVLKAITLIIFQLLNSLIIGYFIVYLFKRNFQEFSFKVWMITYCILLLVAAIVEFFGLAPNL